MLHFSSKFSLPDRFMLFLLTQFCPRRRRIYSSYVNSFDSALSRLQTWTVEPRPRTSNGGTVTVLPQDPTATSATPISSSQRKRIKSYLKVSFPSLFPSSFWTWNSLLYPFQSGVESTHAILKSPLNRTYSFPSNAYRGIGCSSNLSNRALHAKLPEESSSPIPSSRKRSISSRA